MYVNTVSKTIIGLTLCLCLSLLIGQAKAVDPGKTSYTAEVVCAMRAIAASDPDPKTRNPDHMAKLFVNPTLKQRFPGLGLDYEDAKLAMDQMNTGAFYYVNARTLHMDALLTQSLKAGFRQVVIMGAGFDSRAYRFHDAYPDVRFFEIDLPATSADKQQRVEKLLGRRPDWVTFVPIDFNTQTLDEVLGKAGFATDHKTFYVWEGVTYYISQAGVDGTLRFIARQSAPGSRIVFDYMLAEVVQGLDYSAYGARRTVYLVANSGEPYVFGIAPRQLETFINLRGLTLLSDLGPEDLTQRYLIQSNGTVSGKIAEFVRIVHAEVPETSERQRLIGRTEIQMKQFPSDKAPDPAAHLVDIPNDVQAILSDYSETIARKNFEALLEFFSKNFRSNGYTREQAVASIRWTYLDRPIHQYKIILTRFDRQGNKARVDGFVQRKGFRTPFKPTGIAHIAKEADGRWRLYGNQNF
jgi:methyltransferase (TIGR00027 family)